MEQPHPDQLVLDQLHLPLPGPFLGLEACDLLPELCDPLPEDPNLAPQGVLPRSEDGGLARHEFRHRCSTPAYQELRWELDLDEVLELRVEACVQGSRSVELPLDDPEGGMRSRRVEPEEGITDPYDAAVSDEEFGHDPAIQVLNVAPASLHDDDATRQDRAVQLGNGGPGAEDAEGQQNGQ